MNRPVALAIAAHPDDIEFMMAGTLLQLGARGWEIHYLNVANGSCGSDAGKGIAKTISTRQKEAKAAARLLGAHFHPSLTNDLEVFYELRLLRKLAAVVREVAPRIILTHSPEDYMEDHTNAARLAVTAGFARGMPNFETRPRRSAVAGDVTVYHAMPHGLRDGFGCRRIAPELFVNIEAVQQEKCAALAAHKSQQQWLNASQGMDSILKSMEEVAVHVGAMSGRFMLAEGWRRHNATGFCAEDADPLSDALKSCCLRNREYLRY